MRLLLDENLSLNQAIYLREAGYDAVAAIEVGLGGKKDEKVRVWAVDNNRIILTLDADFANLLRFPAAGTPGVIRLKVHPPTEDTVREQIFLTLSLLAGRSLVDCLVVSHKNIVRIRK